MRQTIWVVEDDDVRELPVSDLESGTRTPGTYLLLMALSEERVIEVGRLGTFRFAAGWYAYAGSALGGLAQRISRHLRPSAVRRWHLDYLRAAAPVRAVLVFPGRERRECALARAVLSLPGATIPAARFGASDCHCPSHLAHLPPGPPWDDRKGWTSLACALRSRTRDR